MQSSPGSSGPRIGGSRLRRVGVAFLLAPLLGAPGPSAAQEGPALRQVVSNQIAVSSDEATILLEFADGERLEVSFRQGRILVNDEPLGGYERGDPLEGAWRRFMGEAVALDDGPLARALMDWSPPAELTGDAAGVAERLDRSIEESLAARAPAGGDAPAADAPVAPASPDQERLLRTLLGRADLLRGLGEAIAEGGLEGVEHLYIDQDVRIEEDVEGDVVMVDGELDVAGTIRGDVVVVGGSIRLREGSYIEGEVVTVDSRVYRQGGEVSEGVSVLEMGRMEGPDREELRAELREELRRELSRHDGFGGVFDPLRNVIGAVVSVIGNFVTFGVLALLGMLAVHFLGDKLEIVADAAKRAPVRSGMVGMAASFLFIPVWILGAAALAITIIGIPVAVLWLLLYPIAAALAVVAGYLAVSGNLGEWVAEQRFPYLEDRVRASNRVHTVVLGVGTLMLLFVAASVLSAVRPWLDFLQALLLVAAIGTTVVVALMGLGAILLTRGGRLRLYIGPSAEGVDWSAEPGAGTGKASSKDGA